MNILKVRLAHKRGYDIVVGSRILNALGARLARLEIGTDVLVVTNRTVKRRWGRRLHASLRGAGLRVRFEEVADTEKSKSIATCIKLLMAIADYGRLRRVFIVAFGGGVIGDLAGFVASIYKRGIPYVQVPTTLVGQVDSAIGGKVAVDLTVGKNLVGAFYQPRLVFSDVDLLTTLPRRQITEGLAEVIKYGVMKDERLFRFLERSIDEILGGDRGRLAVIVRRSSQIKADVVRRDEYDTKGARALLNYGHTIGHALEAAAGYSKRYTHGMAVSVGMVAANAIALEAGLMRPCAAARIERLLARAGLPTRARGLSATAIYAAHRYDKKFVGKKNRFILATANGAARVVENIPEGVIKRAIRMICGR